MAMGDPLNLAESSQRVSIRGEVSRIHESAVYSAQGQFEAAKAWRTMLIVTYKPAVRSAWRGDLLTHVDFIDWQYIDRDTPPSDADTMLDNVRPTVWFASFQDVIGRDAEGKPKPRNETLHIVDWDCIVIDEFHFGASTAAAREVYDPKDKAEAAFAQMFQKATDESDENVADVVIEPDFGLTNEVSSTPIRNPIQSDHQRRLRRLRGLQLDLHRRATCEARLEPCRRAQLI